MKHFLLFLLVLTITYAAIADDEQHPVSQIPVSNIKAFGYYGSGRLPVGYQFFMGFEHIGKLRTGLGIQIINQFSSGANHDLSGTVFRKSTLLRHGRFADMIGYNVRMRKLQFTENPAVVLNQKVWYTLIFRGTCSLGAGIEYMKGTVDDYGLLINAGKYFRQSRINCNASCSFVSGHIDYKTSVSKTISVGNSASTNYGIELSLENFRGYKDVSLGVLMYF